jgi:hypothetical protein
MCRSRDKSGKKAESSLFFSERSESNTPPPRAHVVARIRHWDRNASYGQEVPIAVRS